MVVKLFLSEKDSRYISYLKRVVRHAIDILLGKSHLLVLLRGLCEKDTIN